ncbi:NADH-quinone oxidoreductase subunit C [Sphingomonas sp. URHD0057]|uniref:NADH-quinone oxidoreductase subunit C n=1 Tax=Sphingomonas sp. URHD0057 TaxID=1380389 RepID=UPI00048F827A|nr:NADH-quinone oxidoreductase subunit C [Sphingomonas sp. URHD0057]
MASAAPRYADAPASLGKLAGARPRAGLETAFDVDRGDLVAVLKALRDEHEYQQLMEIAGVDYPDRAERFEVVYCLLSLTRNHRVRVHVATDEETPVPSVTGLWAVAGWLEREVYDMYGVGFSGNDDLRRILTDYGFEGFPQRKDFPLTGHIELRYSEAEKRVVYEPVSLPQDFRTFDFLMPWEGPEYVLPGDEKAKAESPGAPSPMPAPGGPAPQNVKTPAETPKTTEKPAQTGGGAPADKQATKEARKPRVAKAKGEVSKKPRAKKA